MLLINLTPYNNVKQMKYAGMLISTGNFTQGIGNKNHSLQLKSFQGNQ